MLKKQFQWIILFSTSIPAGSKSERREGGLQMHGTRIVDGGLDSTRFESRPHGITLLDRYDSNWHAQLDGRETPVLRANQLFRAVYAPAGTHALRFYYHQRGLLPGAVISALTLLLLA